MGRVKTSITDMIKIVFEAYRNHFKDSYGNSTYKFRGTDRTGTRELIEAIGFVETLKRLDRFFNSASEWLNKRGHPYPVFLSTAEQYAERKDYGSGKIAKRREADSEIAKFRRKKSNC